MLTFTSGCKKSSRWLQGRKTPTEREKRTTYFPYKDKTVMVPKILGKRDISKEIKKGRNKKREKEKEKKEETKRKRAQAVI